MKKGFSLVEILVVISVIAVMSVVLTQIFFRTLRGNNKAQIIETIKQNGQIALETMDKAIRGTDNVVCSSADLLTLVVENNLGSDTSQIQPTYTRFRFVPPTFQINGSIQKDSPVSYSDTICDEVLSQSAITITDTNPKNGISIQNGQFTFTKQAGFQAVTISFQVIPGVAAPSVVAGQIDPVAFSTTIELR